MENKLHVTSTLGILKRIFAHFQEFLLNEHMRNFKKVQKFYS